MKRSKLNVITAMVLLLAMGVLLLSGCNFASTVLRGRGDLVSHNIQSDNFTGLNISGAYELTFHQSIEYSVILEIQDNLFPLVMTDVRDGVLYIKSTKNFYTTTGNTPRLYITAPNIKSVDFSGAVIANLDLCVDSMSINISGAGDVTLDGSAKTLNINNDGAANVKTTNMISKDVSVSVAGTGVVETYATDTLNVRISGVGLVRYDGDPQLTHSISLLGSIEKRS